MNLKLADGILVLVDLVRSECDVILLSFPLILSFYLCTYYVPGEATAWLCAIHLPPLCTVCD